MAGTASTLIFIDIALSQGKAENSTTWIYGMSEKKNFHCVNHWDFGILCSKV